MKTECNLIFDIFDTTEFTQNNNLFEGYNSQKTFNKNIMGLSPSEFILVKNNKVSMENKIYKFPFLNIFELDKDTDNYINFDLND